MNIFPFTLPGERGCGRQGQALFAQYAATHKSALAAAWGTDRYCDHVDVEVLSPTEVCFVIYGARSAGDRQHHAYTDGELASAIAQRRLELATQVHDMREVEAARIARCKAIDAVHLELFGDLPGDAA